MKKEKILYVSDLDGTLLTNDQTLSDFTADTINKLTEEGMCFSYATARSFVTAGEITEKIHSNIPVIVHNGAFILENSTGKILWGSFFSYEEARKLLDTLIENKIYPMVHNYIDGKEKLTFYEACNSKGVADFLDTRRGDERLNNVEPKDFLQGEIFHFTCIDDKEKLLKICDIFRNEFQCIYYTDIYSGYQWLEILPKSAGKGIAILELKRMLNCTKVVCFGDGHNDINMFSIADECYAVENAEEDLKHLATGVIGSNMDDGVAKWLLENYEN